jgi:predicted phosphodiesterase
MLGLLKPTEPTALRIQLASDLHLERFERRFPDRRLLQPAPGADLLVLAGDIHNGTHAVATFADWPVPVLYVAGNHEFYDHDWASTRQTLRGACAGTSMVFLDNDEWHLGGVRFLGSTLWTDFQLPGLTQAQAMADVSRSLTDYRVIRAAGGVLTVQQTLADHRESRRWLEERLAQAHAGPTVVVTHHAPHPSSIHARFAGHPINAGFVSDLSPLLAGADLWLHGHTHDSFDYRVGRCRVVANPAGYVHNRAESVGGGEPVLENAAFDPWRVLDVPM